MLNKLSGYRTFIAMGLAFVVGLWQHFDGPLPAIDPEMWNIFLPIVAIGLRLVTKSAPFTKVGE